MDNPGLSLSLASLLYCLIPVSIVSLILFFWTEQFAKPGYALLRMTTQLLLVGYFLNYLFTSNSSLLILGVLLLMLLISSWIALQVIGATTKSYGYALLAILIGGGSLLILLTQVVLAIDPWFKPAFLIPLAGMLLANSMNGTSLAAERLLSEIKNGADYITARNRAYRAALIPITNSMFAAGLVALPGMMTGQILAGISPLIAVRYQIIIISFLLGAVGISAAIFLTLVRKPLENDPASLTRKSV